MIRLLLLPLALLSGFVRLMGTRFGVLGLILGVLLVAGLAVAPIVVGVFAAFHTSVLLGLVVTFLPPLWAINWWVGLIDIVFHANLYHIIAHALAGAA